MLVAGLLIMVIIIIVCVKRGNVTLILIFVIKFSECISIIIVITHACAWLGIPIIMGKLLPIGVA